MLGQLILNGFVLGATIALMAIGFTLIFGILGIVNYWHGEAYMFGAVIVYYLVVGLNINYFIALSIAVLAVGLLGWISDKVIFRRFHGNLIGGAIAALALLMIFQNSMWLVLGGVPRGIPSVVTANLKLFNTNVSSERVLIVVISIGVILTLAWFIKYTRLGKAMRATQQDSEAATTMGINIRFVCGLTFGIATGLAALAGGLIGPLFSVTPPMGLEPLLLALIVVILGGMGSIMGAFIASFIIGFQQSFTAAYWGIEYALTLSFGLALLILIFKPTGLLGHD